MSPTQWFSLGSLIFLIVGFILGYCCVFEIREVGEWKEKVGKKKSEKYW